jgi:ParB family chromosome partitioning protein
VTVRERPQGLGRGLGALIPQRGPTGTGSIEIHLARIRENPRQPRLRMNDEALEGLADSIRQHGVLQPVLVT